MKISPQEIITDEQFQLIHILSYENVISFVFSHIKKINLATILFFFFNILFLLFGFFKVLEFVASGFISWKYVLLNIFLGFIFYPVLLIPIHELIHALMYKLIGAPKIKFGTDLSQYIFYVAADNYVINFKELLWVALAPFFLISGFFLLAFHLNHGPYAISFICTLIAHGTMCIGDFAVLSFFLENGHKDVVNFDKIEEKKSYFYKSSSR